MITSLQRIQSTFSRTVRIPTAQEVKAYWNDYTPRYDAFDSAPQTFFYSMVSLMQLQEANNILQVACGTGKLLSVVLDKKRQESSYLASDIAENMVEKAQFSLHRHFQKYQSKLSFQEWCNNQNLHFRVLNAQEPIPEVKPFDRIFCNLALMITPDPLRLLRNIHNHAAPGALFGVSVWGSKEQNTLFNCIRESLIESEVQLPEERSNFHLYKKVGGLAEQSGWEVLLNWDQNVLFPVLEYEPGKHSELLQQQVSKLPQEYRQKVRTVLHNKLLKAFQTKKGLNFSVDMFILRKK